MAKRYELVDPRTGRRLVLVERSHKPPARRRRQQVIVHREPVRTIRVPSYEPPYDEEPRRRRKAISWGVGLAWFFAGFVACEIHPALTIGAWGLLLAWLVARSMRD
jgi:hypothetical protein